MVVTVTCNHNTMKNLYSIKSYHATSIEQLNSSSQIDLQNVVVNIGVACAQKGGRGNFQGNQNSGKGNRPRPTC